MSVCAVCISNRIWFFLVIHCVWLAWSFDPNRRLKWDRWEKMGGNIWKIEGKNGRKKRNVLITYQENKGEFYNGKKALSWKWKEHHLIASDGLENPRRAPSSREKSEFRGIQAPSTFLSQINLCFAGWVRYLNVFGIQVRDANILTNLDFWALESYVFSKSMFQSRVLDECSSRENFQKPNAEYTARARRSDFAPTMIQ